MVTDHTLSLVTGERVEIRNDGAHITSWRTGDGVERLFLSERAEFRPGAAIRGGVPIIFPQFAGFGPLPKHGFARTAQWQRVLVPSEANGSAVFRLQDSEATRAVWPQSFMAEYTVALGRDELRMTLMVRNTGQQVWSFTAALHTYLRVQDISRVGIAGLQGSTYGDSAAGGVQVKETEADVRIAGEVDRIYFSTPRPITINVPGQRSMVCSATGFTDTVIWNPGADKSAALSDMEPHGYQRMLCVEAAVVAQPVLLQPGSEWSGVQQLTLV